MEGFSLMTDPRSDASQEHLPQQGTSGATVLAGLGWNAQQVALPTSTQGIQGHALLGQPATILPLAGAQHLAAMGLQQTCPPGRPTVVPRQPSTAATEDTIATHEGGSATQGESNPALRSSAPKNKMNKYKGVQFDRIGTRKWRARIHTDKTRHIGYYDTEEEAAQAWDMAAIKYFGEGYEAKLNFGKESILKYRELHSTGEIAVQPSVSASKRTKSTNFRGVVQLDAAQFKAVVQHQRNHITVGIYSTAEEAAKAYDLANIQYNGAGAITNFPITDYTEEVEKAHRREREEQVKKAYMEAELVRQGGRAYVPLKNKKRKQVHDVYEQALAHPGAYFMMPPMSQSQNPFMFGSMLPSHHNLNVLPQQSPPLAAFIAEQQEIQAAAQRRQLDELAAVPSSALLPSPLYNPQSVATPIPGLVGVTKVGSHYEAAVPLNLGTFNTAEEAAKMHDIAAINVGGFMAKTNYPLTEVIQMATAPRETVVGVLTRDESYVALLDIGGKPYELGPFVSAEEAAKAYDRYSVMLHGAAVTLNKPVWEHLAQPAEIKGIVDAISTVQLLSGHPPVSSCAMTTHIVPPIPSQTSLPYIPQTVERAQSIPGLPPLPRGHQAREITETLNQAADIAGQIGSRLSKKEKGS